MITEMFLGPELSSSLVNCNKLTKVVALKNIEAINYHMTSSAYFVNLTGDILDLLYFYRTLCSYFLMH